jgi:N-acetylglutamate synthase-like GNAT family acetyltransferase
MNLVPATGPLLETILDGTYPHWGEGLTREAYGRWNRAQMETPWGRDHLSRMALVDDDGRLLASAKRYAFRARAAGRVVDLAGIGAVFTPVDVRGRGHAAVLLDRLHADAASRGCEAALLFSEIGEAMYARLGYQTIPARELTLEVTRRDGAPATLVRSLEPRDFDHIADISMRYAESAAFALERTPALVAFGASRRRLLAGLGPAGMRAVEFFVAEEGTRAVAYVVITHGPNGLKLEDCGDRDPAGARIGAILQVLDARSPADPPMRLVARLPATLRPPQVRVLGDGPAADIMMIKPLGASTLTASTLEPAVYWMLDLF